MSGQNKEGQVMIGVGNESRDWAGWAQVFVPMIIAIGVTYSAIKSDQAVFMEKLTAIASQQEVMMALVQPLDKQVAINKLEIENLKEDVDELKHPDR